MGGSDPGDGGVRPGDGGVRPRGWGGQTRGWGGQTRGWGGQTPGMGGRTPRDGGSGPGYPGFEHPWNRTSGRPPPALPVAQPRTWVWHPKLEPFGCQVWGGPKDWGYKFWTYCDLSKNATSLRPVLIGRVEIGTPRSSDGGADFGMGGATTPSPGSDPPGWGGPTRSGGYDPGDVENGPQTGGEGGRKSASN